jgi:hypothetical protein
MQPTPDGKFSLAWFCGLIDRYVVNGMPINRSLLIPHRHVLHSIQDYIFSE